jgi:hypothetical protein
VVQPVPVPVPVLRPPAEVAAQRLAVPEVVRVSLEVQEVPPEEPRQPVVGVVERPEVQEVGAAVQRRTGAAERLPEVAWPSTAAERRQSVSIRAGSQRPRQRAG